MKVASFRISGSFFEHRDSAFQNVFLAKLWKQTAPTLPAGSGFGLVTGATVVGLAVVTEGGWVISWEFKSRLSQNAKVLKCCAPEAFSGAKFQVLMENSNKKWVGKG